MIGFLNFSFFPSLPLVSLISLLCTSFHSMDCLNQFKAKAIVVVAVVVVVGGHSNCFRASQSDPRSAAGQLPARTAHCSGWRRQAAKIGAPRAG